MNGGEGDDFLWGRYFSTGFEKLYGGNGDDVIYGSYKAVQNSNTSTLAGQGGRDVIRTDIYKDNIAENNRRQFIVFGDWGYGEDGSYEGVQYGDPRLEKKLQGDADTIIFGDSPNTFWSGQTFYAGDGDDVITMGNEYRNSLGYAGRGNDIINLPGSFDDFTSTVKVYGGLGDDQLLAPAAGDGGDTVILDGGAGNDKIEGIALVTNEQFLYGGAGDDKIIAADG